MNHKRVAAAILAGLLGAAGTSALLTWAPIWLIPAAFTPYMVVIAAWDRWADRIPALAPRPAELVTLNALGRPVRFQARGAGDLRPEERAELARRDLAYGLLGGPSGGGGDKPPQAPFPPTVARVLMRAHHPDSDQAERVADTGDLALTLLLAELAARGPWN